MPASCAAYSADASARCRAGCAFDENNGVGIPGGEELTEIPTNISGARASRELCDAGDAAECFRLSSAVVEYGAGPGAGAANLAHGGFCLMLGCSKAKTRWQFPLLLGQGQSLLFPLVRGETSQLSAPKFSTVQQRKRMSAGRSACSWSLGNITSEELPGRAPLAGDGQPSLLQESRRWLMATVPAQVEAPSAESAFS